jgi:hypothetical protein
MSKTLAAEIAERCLAVTNPANRTLALKAALLRHGFAARVPEGDELAERAALAEWLLATYSPRE